MGITIFGIDQSENMLNLAKQKSSTIPWFVGNVESLPFPDCYFSGVLCVLAIHHFGNLQRVFNEASRIMQQSGRFVVFTATAEQMERYWLNHYFPEMMQKSIAQMPAKEKIISTLQLAGFQSINLEPYEIKSSLEDLFLYSGKNKPQMYLDPQIRRNSSSFAALADPVEVEKGCASLSKDIRLGKIIEVMDNYKSEQLGDYLFITGCKA
jgi:SAM-dependent methyltransferase